MKRFFIFLYNIFVFVLSTIEVGHPPWRWHIGWRLCQERHRQDIHKIIWELKCDGKIREDKQGRLWPIDKE